MEFDLHYGAVVCAQPPFNLMILPFQWVTFLPLSDEFLLQYNHFLCLLLYFPIACVLTSYFTIYNTLYIPFAWIKHTITLVSTLTSGNETMDEWSERFIRLQTIILFLIFGPVFLTLAIPIDSFVFFYNLYTIPLLDEVDDEDLITMDELDTFQLSCTQTLKYERFHNPKQNLGSRVNFVKLNKNLQSKFMIQRKIWDLVYGNFDDDKFVYNEVKKKTVLNPKYLTSIKQFTLIKKLVSSCAESNNLVDIELLRSLID